MKSVFKSILLGILIAVLNGVCLHGQTATHSHQKEGETCFICDPAKRDAGRLWCRGHARYEDRCWLCHPELEDKNRPYCSEHFLYEDECFLCDPDRASTGDAHPEHDEPEDDKEHNQAARPQSQGGQNVGNSDAGRGLFCNEHGVPEIECAICQPQLAGSLEPGQSLKIRMPSEESASRAGIETDSINQRATRPQVESLCEIQYNLNDLAKVSAFADGIILEVLKDVGALVREGDPLVILHSAQVADAKSAYLSASVEAEIRRKAFERESRLREQNIASEREYLEAEASYQTALLAENNYRQKLVNLGLTENEIVRTEELRDTSATLHVRAPFDGTIVNRSAVRGESASIGQPLVTVADLSTFWLALSIPTEAVGKILVGQPVEAQFSELPGVTLRGRIDWIDPSLDPRSRMLRARAVVEQPAVPVQNGLYGKAYISLDNIRPMSLLPRDAVQQHEGAHFVFVEEALDLYALRRVSVGASIGDQVEVVAGLQPEDAVVVKGTFVVMSEFLKSRLGAGCAGH